MIVFGFVQFLSFNIHIYEKFLFNEHVILFFSADHTPVFLNLNGPNYVKTNTKFLLNCFSSKIPTNFTATFSLNGHVYTKLQRQLNGCWWSSTNSQCLKPACECSSDGRNYSVQYSGLPYEGTLTFTCQMELPGVGKISDCKFVRVFGKPIYF